MCKLETKIKIKVSIVSDKYVQYIEFLLPLEKFFVVISFLKTSVVLYCEHIFSVNNKTRSSFRKQCWGLISISKKSYQAFLLIITCQYFAGRVNLGRLDLISKTAGCKKSQITHSILLWTLIRIITLCFHVILNILLWKNMFSMEYFSFWRIYLCNIIF